MILSNKGGMIAGLSHEFRQRWLALVESGKFVNTIHMRILAGKYR